MKKRPRMTKADRQVQEASDAATWDAIEAYRDTGEMVPTVKDGKLVFLTVDEALRSRDDYERRRRATGEWRLRNLLAQFAAEGQTVTPDVWDRLEADRRQALADDLAWIEKGRAISKEPVAKPVDAIVPIASNRKSQSLPDAFETNASTGDGGFATASRA